MIRITFAEDSGEATLAVLDNDALPAGESGSLVISAVGTPSAGGTVSNTGAALLYTPAADFSGTETIAYTVTAPDGGTAVATATITVTAEPDAPLLADDTYSFAEDSGEASLAVLDNDALPAGESGSLVISAVGTPSAGGTVSNTGAALLYTPAADFSGTETIAYTVTAPDGGTATATATIEIFSYTASIDADDPSGETGGGLDQTGGTLFDFAEIDGGGGDFSASYTIAAIDNVADVLAGFEAGFEAEVVDGTSGQVWDLNFSSSFSGEVQITLAYDDALVDAENLTLAHVHDGVTQILTRMPAGSSGPALLDQYIVDETLRQIQVTVDQFSGLVLFNQQTSSEPSTIAGRVFLDANGNGQLDTESGEIPVGGVEILLTSTAGTAQTTYTAADGSYLFEELVEGDYTITQDPNKILQQVFADGVDTVGTQGGTADDANDQIVIDNLAPEINGQNNLHAEGSLQAGFFSRRDLLSRTPKTEFVAIVQPGAARAVAYTLNTGWEGIDAAEVQLSQDRSELEVRVTEGGITEAVVLDATDPAQVWFRGRRNDTYLLGIVGSRSDWAFAPVTAGSTSGSSGGSTPGTSSLLADDGDDAFVPAGDGGSETETVDAVFDELGSDVVPGETIL